MVARHFSDTVGEISGRVGRLLGARTSRGGSLMSLPPRPNAPVPAETARVARTAFRKGNPYLRLRDHFGTLFTDADFADLFPTRGQPALAPWRLALVTIFQFA